MSQRITVVGYEFYYDPGRYTRKALKKLRGDLHTLWSHGCRVFLDENAEVFDLDGVDDAMMARADAEGGTAEEKLAQSFWTVKTDAIQGATSPEREPIRLLHRMGAVGSREDDTRQWYLPGPAWELIGPSVQMPSSNDFWEVFPLDMQREVRENAHSDWVAWHPNRNTYALWDRTSGRAGVAYNANTDWGDTYDEDQDGFPTMIHIYDGPIVRIGGESPYDARHWRRQGEIAEAEDWDAGFTDPTTTEALEDNLAQWALNDLAGLSTEERNEAIGEMVAAYEEDRHGRR